jgi:thiol:disulfide interchange protein DsbC
VKICLRLSLLACLMLAAAPVSADEERIKRELGARLTGSEIESVRKTPYLGLYEVVIDGEIVYTDEKMEYFFSGDIFDARTVPPRNLTEAPPERSAIGVLARASRDSAIKRVRGNGRRVLYTFEDPNCGFCKSLHREIGRLDDVTVYIFPMPILSQDSVEKAIAAWCAEDRTRAWGALMSDIPLPALPKDRAGCAHPLQKVMELAKRFGINSTPVVFLGNGVRINGYVPADRIEKAFAERQ